MLFVRTGYSYLSITAAAGASLLTFGDAANNAKVSSSIHMFSSCVPFLQVKAAADGMIATFTENPNTQQFSTFASTYAAANYPFGPVPSIYTSKPLLAICHSSFFSPAFAYDLTFMIAEAIHNLTVQGVSCF